MSIVTYHAKKSRAVRGTNVAEGQVLYAVSHSGRFFVWSYTDRNFAEKMDKRLEAHQPDAADIAANWRKSTSDLTPSGRTTF